MTIRDLIKFRIEVDTDLGFDTYEFYSKEYTVCIFKTKKRLHPYQLVVYDLDLKILRHKEDFGVNWK